MKTIKNKQISVLGKTITIDKTDYISLTDIARHKDPSRTDYIIQNWLRTRSAKSPDFAGKMQLKSLNRSKQ
ncbi:KilA-N domain-containing protein [Galbibacter sp. EGI 63066]|uniref:KilA-N domain-containing protein n=1 Tax=Galbibacter sp. EGI 63066 TaxID=2993559 RepID=UPI0022495671|nr:KilA-N domain-containing protein [Galbibacter sp. EGI 63066]MCX2680550.1 KilA-N domain-containing protein [Galbibacter sp. EGI 63066]